MKFNEIKVPDSMEFVDISSEKWRLYRFGNSANGPSDGTISEVYIAQPIALFVSNSGSHRLIDSKGVSHYIPTGWTHLQWSADPQFVF